MFSVDVRQRDDVLLLLNVLFTEIEASELDQVHEGARA